MTPRRSFGTRLEEVLASRGPLTVGIDPHPHLLREWELPDSAEGAREFGLRVVDAAADLAGLIKPQVAFFERHGSRGFAGLEEVLRAARQAGLIVIADVKRGDVGTSVAAYGEAWLTPGSPLEADAMTVSAYQGFGSLREPAELAERSGKGLFVLAATSNPESAAGQRAVIQRGEQAGSTVAAGIVGEVLDWNRAHSPEGTGSVGLVLGATLRLEDYGIDTSDARSAPPVLAPGFGHQGARVEDAPSIFGSWIRNTLIAQSRSILQMGPSGIRSAIQRSRTEVQRAIGR